MCELAVGANGDIQLLDIVHRRVDVYCVLLVLREGSVEIHILLDLSPGYNDILMNATNAV